MSFQKKMVAAYTAFVLIVAVVIGFFYHGYNYNQYKNTEQKNLEISADQLVTQMDDLIKPMELAIDYMLSDSNILSSIRMLATIGENTDIPSLRYRSEAIDAIQKGISTDYLTYTFYRTIFFNQNKVAISTYRASNQKLNNAVLLEEMPWLDTMQSPLANLRIVAPHLDSWRSSGAEKVFSLVKQIQGVDMGYIEIQRLMTDLPDNLQIAKEDVDYMIFINDDELLYSTKEFENLEKYQQLLKNQQEIVEIEGEEYFIAVNKSEKYDVTVLAFENSKVLDNNSRYIMTMTLLVAGVFFLISTVFVNILSGYLTKPIRQLREVMEKTNLENMGDDVQVKTPNDEIEALNISYQDLLERLQESLVKEKRLSLLQIQAQFDTLQSQVNPHFLYNVLNVISARGVADNDEKICEMCGSLAMMLRYSTNTKTRYASIAQELEYLEQYFYLLKARYEYKLEYEIKVDAKIEDQIVPKMVLQQIVENCINHGFQNSTGQMYVRIEGGIKGNHWNLTVHDNGEGFSEEAMKKLQQKFSTARKRLLKERSNMELEIGGMGLNNSYARMLLLYNDDLIFELKNSEDGADVIIGGTYQKRES